MNCESESVSNSNKKINWTEIENKLSTKKNIYFFYKYLWIYFIFDWFQLNEKGKNVDRFIFRSWVADHIKKIIIFIRQRSTEMTKKMKKKKNKN
jgi:hypothetical protein